MAESPYSPLTSPPSHATGAVILEDGSIFYGTGAGSTGIAGGEICFNTAMSGYQEILTDPSYARQIITFTFPEIGVCGANPEDFEAQRSLATGCIIRCPLTAASNFRATSNFNDWLKKHEIVAITGVDTRAITQHLRKYGAQNAVIIHDPEGNLKTDILQQMVKSVPSMSGAELASIFSRKSSETWQKSLWKLGEGYTENHLENHHIVAIDFGAKDNILRHLAQRGCKVTIVPAQTSAEEILALKPNGIFLSNGPGDPAATAEYAAATIQALIKENLPVFGICLGHQLLATALGATTTKMTFGHRGANHPVRNNITGAVEITSQNHGFMVDKQSLPDNVMETHTSLFDQSIEGIALKDRPVFSVQYHPEASPGPHDSHYLFDQFIDNIASYSQKGN